MWFAEADKIYILPMGKLPWHVLEAVQGALAETFGKEVAISEEMPPPIYAYDRQRQQCLSTEIVESVAGMELDGMVLSVVDIDLYVPGLNFVFGEASPENGVALISLTRLKQQFYGEPPNEELFMLRAVKEAIHEIGHLYGLSHCPDTGCVMHFSDSLIDTDRKSERFCGLCSGSFRY